MQHQAKLLLIASIAVFISLLPLVRDVQGQPRAYQLALTPNWNQEETSFWYLSRLRHDRWQMTLVEATVGGKHELGNSEELKKLWNTFPEEQRQKIEPLRWRQASYDFKLQELIVPGTRGAAAYHPKKKTFRILDQQEQRARSESLSPSEPSARSGGGGEETEIHVENRTGGPLELLWVDGQGNSRSYGTVEDTKTRTQHTFVSHVWELKSENGESWGRYRAARGSNLIALEKGMKPQPAPRRNLRRRNQSLSPDGKWRFERSDGNLILVEIDGDKKWQVTDDASESISYAPISWSPNGRFLAAQRRHEVEVKTVPLVESSHNQGPRASLHIQQYLLPGDPMSWYEIVLIDVDQQKVLEHSFPKIDFGTPRLHWNSDSTCILEKVFRGHQRFQLLSFDCESKDSRTLIDEKTETFLWTAHGRPVPLMTYLSKTQEMIHSSEKTGWRHLYLLDPEKEQPLTPITSGDWVVRKIELIDEDQRQIYFAASGVDDGQDPYFLHYFRINFDGSELVRLTDGPGTHNVQFSPQRKWLIATYSRVDLPPVHQLRDAKTGQLVCELEQADITELVEAGRQIPQPFHAVGRDGKTEIWGVITFPQDYDPEMKYPILEEIYAGPHDAHVPKTFRSGEWYPRETKAGFFVVKIDGMGTAHRSKAFHDVCWHNLKDAGFPDRVRWIEAACREIPAMDCGRVGIYGTSAGGQNAGAAVLFHGDFYKAAYASCGCHDNRMDKASWNEQWMGYPVGPHYAENSNIENASRLERPLFLVVGELDRNVPPASTYRFVDALIKANRDCDFLMVPGAGHTSGGPYADRKRIEFFQRELGKPLTP